MNKPQILSQLDCTIRKYEHQYVMDGQARNFPFSFLAQTDLSTGVLPIRAFMDAMGDWMINFSPQTLHSCVTQFDSLATAVNDRLKQTQPRKKRELDLSLMGRTNDALYTAAYGKTGFLIGYNRLRGRRMQILNTSERRGYAEHPLGSTKVPRFYPNLGTAKCNLDQPGTYSTISFSYQGEQGIPPRTFSPYANWRKCLSGLEALMGDNPGVAKSLVFIHGYDVRAE